MNEVKLLKLSFLILQLTVVHALASCASADEDSSSATSVGKYTKLAIAKYHDNISYQVNSAHSYVLCYKQSRPTNQNPFPPLQFFVYDLENDKVQFEDSLVNGSVYWLNDYQLQVSKIPGIVTHDEEANRQLMGYIYDVLHQRKLDGQGERANYP
ncbi:hypothetical protein ACFL6E_04125 [Candidatus Neomarinimicrobiota bacterium]